MRHDYGDIRDNIPFPPLWFDEAAVPRYRKFSPREISSIYAHEAALALIACQCCGKEFQVAFSCSEINRLPKIANAIRSKTLHYGDPPNVWCCPPGPTMNSEPIAVLEYWAFRDLEWQRDSSLEVQIEPDWVAKTA